MRILFIAGYQHPVYHRKIELIADQPDIELLHITNDASDRPTGLYPSANGRKHYEVRVYPGFYPAGKGDSHRSLLWTVDFGMSSFQPDIIHAESDIETLGTAQVALAARLFARKSKLVLFSWQNILRSRKKSVKWLVGNILKAADHIFCASEEAAEVLRLQHFQGGTTPLPLFGVDKRFVSSIPSNEVRQKLDLKGIVIGYVGRLVYEKGVDLLLNAVARLGPQISLLLVGNGPEREQLQELAIALGLEKRCRFVGNLDYEAIAQYMNAMDILVLPSRTTAHWKEQFGRVLVEAMACDVVVVGSNSGAIPEVIGDAGRIFPEDDLETLTKVLSELINQPLLRKSLTEKGKQRIETYYSVEQVASNTVAIWRQLALTAK